MGTTDVLWSSAELTAYPATGAVDHARPTYRHFSTEGLERLARIELWEQHNADALVALAARSIGDVPLVATERNLRVEEMTFAWVGANPHIVERTRDHIAATGTDGVALYFSLAGEAFFYHPDGVHLQRPGTMLACDVNQPFLRGFAHGLQEYVLTVPRHVFEDVTEQPLPRVPVLSSFADIPGGDVHAAALARLIRTSLTGSDPTAVAATEAATLDLLRALFTTDGANSSGAKRRAAIAWIRRNLRDPGLSVSRVAAGVGMSERSLSRVFSESGGAGVARTILEMRLTLAHRMLSAPGAPSVQDVALYCGFATAAHFSRVFREHFDTTPAEVRAAR
ncbi:AraC family transcriptional regulator [Microbacterium gorillae]|uniref:AraC family transcriptional regulator n=1 Tax=Microbacterium gorillae TaxID=1231063 RepID=UPI000A935F10|nr:AraC family transcriptional regulator [Microbacterium gorillae]